MHNSETVSTLPKPQPQPSEEAPANALRIWAISEYYFPNFSGAAIQAHRILGALVNRGHHEMTAGFDKRCTGVQKVLHLVDVFHNLTGHNHIKSSAEGGAPSQSTPPAGASMFDRNNPAQWWTQSFIAMEQVIQ